MFPNLPAWLLEIWDRLEGAGYSTYLVGGGPRDLFLGRTPADWDLATAARPEEVLSLFPEARPTGIRFGTVTVGRPPHTVEVTTLRREGRYLDHRHPSEVVFTIDIREDLSRRDFTVNALTLGRSGEWIDPYGGREDLLRRRLRAVGDPAERFREDPLRLFRGVRLAGELSLRWERETRRALLGERELALQLSRERVWGEVERILRQTSPAATRDLVRSGLLGLFLPGVRPPRVWPASLAARICRLFPGSRQIPGLERVVLPASLRWEVQIICEARRAERRVPRSRYRFLAGIGAKGREAVLAAGDPGLSRLQRDLASGRPFDTAELGVGAEIRQMTGSGPLTGKILNQLREEVWEGRLPRDRSALLGRAGEILAVLRPEGPE